jgi:ubiquinone biosynthesis protein UbiJ
MEKMISPEIRAFLEKLLADKKINVEGDLREQMISDLYDRLEVRFNQLIIEHLSVTELETLAELAETGQDAVQGFLRKSIKNIDKIFAEAMEEFAQIYLEG